MLSISDAHRLIDTQLGDTPRAAHSMLVGRLMHRLAETVGADALLWEITGLCHDLDFEAVAGDWSQHGLLTAQWLADDLPAAALDAIRSHDHRTGVGSGEPIAHALKLADALAIAHDQLGADLARLLVDPPGELALRLSDRPYLSAMIVANADAIQIALPALARIVVSASVAITPVTPDALGFQQLSQHCVVEGHRMLARFEENWRNGGNRFNAPGERVLGVVLDGRLVGLCGRNRDPYDAHPRAGRVRHLYVATEHRRLGIGGLLIEAVVDGAAEWFDYLNTNCPPEAAAFYERLGFVPLTAEHVTHRLSLSQAREEP